MAATCARHSLKIVAHARSAITAAAAALFAVITFSPDAHAQMAPPTTADLGRCSSQIRAYYVFIGETAPDPLEWFMSMAPWRIGWPDDLLAAEFRSDPNERYQGDISEEYYQAAICAERVWLAKYDAMMAGGPGGGPLGINGGNPTQAGGQGGGATEASSTQGGSQQPQRRSEPPSVPVTIIQQLGDQRCPIQARGVTRWQNEDDLSNTNIVTDVEIFHQCATYQLIEVNMDPYSDGALSGFNAPILSGLGGLAHAWPQQLPLPVAWQAYSQATVPMPPNWNPLSVGISQEVSQRRDIQIQVAVCEAFTANRKKRALLIEAGSYMGQGFQHIACADIPAPYNEPN